MTMVATKIEQVQAKHTALMLTDVSRDPYPAGEYPNILPERLKARLDEAVRDAWVKGRADYEEALTAFTRLHGSEPNFTAQLVEFIKNTT